MLEINTLTLGPFATNTYIVTSFPSGEDGRGFLWLIDPACRSAYEQQMLYAPIEKIRSMHPDIPFSIIATHGHLDHLWGAKWATEQWHTPVRMHEADIPMAQAMQQQYDMFGVRARAESFPIAPLRAEDMPGWEILHTPGHTPGSVCLYSAQEQILFSGDTLFRRGYGRTDLPGGDMQQLILSLQRLWVLPSETRVLPGHERPTTIGDER